MKIVLLHGQNHKGSTYHIGRMLAEQLGTESEMTEFFCRRICRISAVVVQLVLNSQNKSVRILLSCSQLQMPLTRQIC